MGKRFELRTYHSGLKYIFEQPTLNARQTRRMEFLSECDFDNKHIKGKTYKVADALDRRVHLMHATIVSMPVRLEEENFRCCCYRSTLPTSKGKLTIRRCTTEYERV